LDSFINSPNMIKRQEFKHHKKLSAEQLKRLKEAVHHNRKITRPLSQLQFKTNTM